MMCYPSETPLFLSYRRESHFWKFTLSGIWMSGEKLGVLSVGPYLTMGLEQSLCKFKVIQGSGGEKGLLCVMDSCYQGNL